MALLLRLDDQAPREVGLVELTVTTDPLTVSRACRRTTPPSGVPIIDAVDASLALQPE